MGFLGSILGEKPKPQQPDAQLDAALTRKNTELAELTAKMRALGPYNDQEKAKLDELRGERERLLHAIYDLETKRHGAAYAEKHKMLRSKRSL